MPLARQGVWKVFDDGPEGLARPPSPADTSEPQLVNSVLLVAAEALPLPAFVAADVIDRAAVSTLELERVGRVTGACPLTVANVREVHVLDLL